MSKRYVTCVLVCAALAIAGGLTLASAAPALEFHWDRGTSSSQATVKNSDGDVLAEIPWGGALPRRYSADEEESEVPIKVLGLLRDQLEPSVQPEADEALDFVRDLMEVHAYTPVEALPPGMGAWIPYSEVSATEFCGTAIDAYGECIDPGEPSMQNLLCSEFACKRTTIQPSN